MPKPLLIVRTLTVFPSGVIVPVPLIVGFKLVKVFPVPVNIRVTQFTDPATG